MPIRVIIAQLPSLKGTDKGKSSSVLLGCPLLPIIWLELQAHPNLWWDFEFNTLLKLTLFKKLYGDFDEMVGGYESSMWYPVGGITITSSMSPLMRPMCTFRIHISYRCFPVQIKIAYLIVSTNIKLPHIRYKAQLILIIEIIYFHYQTLNIDAQHLLVTCGIIICRVYFIQKLHRYSMFDSGSR